MFAEYKQLKEEYDGINVADESTINAYMKLKSQINKYTVTFLKYLTNPRYILPFLNTGRLLRFNTDEGVDLGWGVLLNYKKVAKREAFDYMLDCLVKTERGLQHDDKLVPPADEKNGEMRIVLLSLKNITQISSSRVIVPQDLKTADNRQLVAKSIQEVKRALGNVPLLDPIENMKINDTEFLNVVKKIEACEKKIADYKDLDKDSLALFHNKLEIGQKMEKLKESMEKTRSLLQMEELKCRKRVLRRLGYCTSADVLEVKGRVACEITRWVC